MKRATLALMGLVTAVTTAQPPLTSGVPYPGRAPVFSAPQDWVEVMLVTNERPLVVEQTVSSNVVRRTSWYHEGVKYTNDQPLASNVISRTTNYVVK